MALFLTCTAIGRPNTREAHHTNSKPLHTADQRGLREYPSDHGGLRIPED